MKVGAQELRDEIAVSGKSVAQKIHHIATYMSSRGEMKMSLNEMTCPVSICCHLQLSLLLHFRVASASTASILGRFVWRGRESRMAS